MQAPGCHAEQGEKGPSDLAVNVFHEICPERERCERELDEAGFPLPLAHRCAWALAHRPGRSWFVALRGPAGQCVAGLAAQVNSSRSLPGHLLLRVERFGGNLPPDVREAAVVALAGLARRHPRVLRVSVELLARDPAARAVLEDTLARHGFRPVKRRRCYACTAVLDLAPADEALLAALNPKTRGHIRRTVRKESDLRPIEDPVWAGRIDELVRESLHRTGGRHYPLDWAPLIDLSRRWPNRSRLVGLFRRDATGPGSLLSVAWACHHGDHVHYAQGGATRANDLRIPLAHALVWDLILWAKRNGARWFDLGGITDGHGGAGGDQLGGISDFKRGFSREVVEVGGEWALEPSWARAWLASTLSGGVSLLGRLLGKSIAHE